jgi:heme exporter protein A
MGALSEVEARGLVKDYGPHRALAGVSLKLRAGEATVLLGDNGAGKSTLLGILATLIRPTRGQVLFGGMRAEDIEATDLRAQLGVLAHEPRCYADLSARENLLFFGRLHGVGQEALWAQVPALLARVGLQGAADRPVRTFSRGMVQRLAVARTLLHRPGLLLLDEPYTGLDRAGVALLSELLAQVRDEGAILLCISHDLGAVAALCDQAIVLRRGRLSASARYERGRCTAADLAALYEGPGEARA